MKKASHPQGVRAVRAERRVFYFDEGAVGEEPIFRQCAAGIAPVADELPARRDISPSFWLPNSGIWLFMQDVLVAEKRPMVFADTVREKRLTEEAP